MRMNLDHVASGRFVFGRDVHCEFDYWPLAVSTVEALINAPLKNNYDRQRRLVWSEKNYFGP